MLLQQEREPFDLGWAATIIHIGCLHMPQELVQQNEENHRAWYGIGTLPDEWPGRAAMLKQPPHVVCKPAVAIAHLHCSIEQCSSSTDMLSLSNTRCSALRIHLMNEL